MGQISSRLSAYLFTKDMPQFLVTAWSHHDPLALVSAAARLGFSWLGAELRLLIGLSLLQPLPLMFERARRAETSLCSSISLRAQLPPTCRRDGTQTHGGAHRTSHSSG